MAIFRGVGGSGDSSDNSFLDEVTAQAEAAEASATAAANSASSILGGFSIQGDLDFGGNKAIFGTNDDLQIYNFLGASIIKEAGSGNLEIRATDLVLKDDSGGKYAQFTEDGDAKLFYDNSEKLATTSGGISVTGTITATGYNDSNWNTAYGWGDHSTAGYLTSFDITEQTDPKYLRSDADDTTTGTITAAGLIVDTDTLYVDTANNKVGIGTTTPGSALTVKSSGFSQLRLEDDDDRLEIGYSVATAYFKTGDNNSKINFRKTDNTDVITVDMGNERLGIGTTSPDSTLHVDGIITSTANPVFKKDVPVIEFLSPDGSNGMNIKANLDNDNNYGLQFEDVNGLNKVVIGPTGDVSFYNETSDSTAKFRWDASTESLGIGTSSPDHKLDVSRADVGTLARFQTEDGTNNPELDISTTATGVKVRSAFSTGIAGSFDISSAGGNSYIAFNPNDSEAVRIKSNGNVGIGKTDPSTALDVNGTVTATGLVAGGNTYPTSTGTNGQVLVTNGSGTLSFADQSGGGVSDIVDDTTPQLGGDLDLNSSDITGTGNIDITGTVTADDLSITSSNNVHTVLTSTTTGSSLQLKDATTSATFSGASVIGDTLGLYTNNNENLHIQSDGDVGIGTSSPDEKLEVNGNIKADNLYVGNGTHAAPSISFSGDDDTGISSSIANTLDFSVGGNDRMRLDSSGKLLVGTTSAGSLGSKIRAAGRIESSSGFMATSNGSNFEQAGNYGGAGLTIDGYTTSSTATQKMIALRTSANSEKGNIQIKGNHVLFGCSSGNFLLGASTAHTPTAKLDVDGDTIRLRSDRTPASATASGNKGDICYDSEYIYVCTSTNNWKRIALATW